VVFELQEGSSWCILSGILGFILFLGITLWISLGFPLYFATTVLLSLVVAVIGGFGLSRFEGVIGGIIVGIFTAVAFVILLGVFNFNFLVTATIAVVTNALIEFFVGIAGGFVGVLIRASSIKIHMRPH